MLGLCLLSRMTENLEVSHQSLKHSGLGLMEKCECLHCAHKQFLQPGSLLIPPKYNLQVFSSSFPKSFCSCLLFRARSSQEPGLSFIYLPQRSERCLPGQGTAVAGQPLPQAPPDLPQLPIQCH